MQKNLLAEIHIPKLDLKSFKNNVKPDSARFSCVVEDKNKNGEVIKTLSPGFKVIVGGTDLAELTSESNFPLSSGENVKAVDRKLVFKKILTPTECNFSNGLKKPGLLTTENAPSSLQDFKLRGNVKPNSIQFQPLAKNRFINSKISPKEPNHRNSKRIDSFCIETKSLRDIIDKKPSDEEPDLEIILESKAQKYSNDSSRSLLKQKIHIPEPESAAVFTPEVVETTSDAEKESQPFCVISEVVGSADSTFSDGEEQQENEPQLITPQKTNDITKIKGWRRKQFFVEKPTTVEFYSVSKGSLTLKRKIDLNNDTKTSGLKEEPGDKETAFHCDSLDEFLDRESDLKIGYEIPHLYAEFGIKLTKDEIVSKPNLPEKDIEEIGTRYCRRVSLPSDNTNLDDIKVENYKGLKRPIGDDIKPSKIPKVDEQESDLDVICWNSNITTHLKPKKCVLSDKKLLSKLIALVVYPGPYMPLHPLVQYHLNKIRSYRTLVDKRWARFAASAVLVNDKNVQRKILPAYCCVKVEKNPSAEIEKVEEKNENDIKIKPCSVVIEKLECPEAFNTWCMDHNCHNCIQCGLSKELPVEKITPRESFNRKIARLLAKKVRLLKANGDTLTSIDCLKVLKRDTIEFIKLKFVKESFLTGYINIWYLKPQTNGTRSRAFLTFSKSSPVQNAINLRSTGLSVKHLPKVITEIMSTENSFDSNEYAILHCNGGIWEIHGSLNISFGNSEKNVKQIFTSLELPELKKLQKIAFEILHVEAVKWWVLDLTQKFKLIELKSGNISTVVSREKFFEIITLNLFGFLPLRKDNENRVVGAYVIRRLLPFVLIGPYYLLETQDMILKGVSSTVPFKYYGEENVTTNYPLKFFINSVIKNLEMNHSKLEGLWLYDKMCLDKTTYIEIVTKSCDENSPSSTFSNIEIEHGYSLKSLTHTSPSGAASGIVKRRDGKNELQTVPVYLYFNIFELGFVEGELQFDSSVIIDNPLGERMKMKSYDIGDWFISIIKQKVKLIPKHMVVRWFITKHKGDLNGRLPFNKFILRGAHVLTKDGVFYISEMSEAQKKNLGLLNETKELSDCEVITEMKELKNLSDLFLNESERMILMDDVLTQTVNEIRSLKKIQKLAKEEKMLEERKKLDLVSDFLKLVNSLRIRHHFKIKMIVDIQHMFVDGEGYLTEDFVKKLKKYRVGWKFLKRLKKIYVGDAGENVKYKMKDYTSDKFQFGNFEEFIMYLQKNYKKSLITENETAVNNLEPAETNSQFENTAVNNSIIVKKETDCSNLEPKDAQPNTQFQHVAVNRPLILKKEPAFGNLEPKDAQPNSQLQYTAVYKPSILKKKTALRKLEPTDAQPNSQFKNAAFLPISARFRSSDSKHIQIKQVPISMMEPQVEIEVQETRQLVFKDNFPQKNDGFLNLTSNKLPRNVNFSWKNSSGKKLKLRDC